MSSLIQLTSLSAKRRNDDPLNGPLNQRDCRITVGILTRNSMRTLPETLESLRRQILTVATWEIVFVDHNSEDGTRQLLERFSLDRRLPKGHSRIVNRSENNLSRSRQVVVESSRAPWIVFVDSDVILPADWLAKALAIAEGKMEDCRFGGVAGPLKLKPKSPQLRELRLMQRQFLGHFRTEQMMPKTRPRLATHLPTAAALFRRSAIVEIGGFNIDCGDCGEDLDLGERLSHDGSELWIMPELQVEHIFSCETKRQWIQRAFRFGRARVKVASFNPHLFLQIRLWLPVALATVQILGLFSLFALPAMAAGVLLALAAWPALDLVMLFTVYLCSAEPSMALSAAVLTLATHLAFAWGELFEVFRLCLVRVAAFFFQPSQQQGRAVRPRM